MTVDRRWRRWLTVAQLKCACSAMTEQDRSAAMLALALSAGHWGMTKAAVVHAPYLATSEPISISFD
jgi:hypothetical protein